MRGVSYKMQTNNFQEDISSGERLALLPFPGRNSAFRHGWAHCWHVERSQRTATRRDMETYDENKTEK